MLLFYHIGHDKHSNSRSNSGNSSARDGGSSKSSSRQSDKRSGDYWGSGAPGNSSSGGRDDAPSSRDRDRGDKDGSREQRERERDRDRDSCREDAQAAQAAQAAAQAAAAAAAAQQAQQAQDRQAQDMDISPGDSTPTSEPITTPSAHDPLPQGPVLLATGELRNTFFLLWIFVLVCIE